MDKKKHLVLVGAHCGDVELQAGAIAHKYAKAGWDVTFLHLTAGEKGNPPNVSVEDYRIQKMQEAEKAAEVLGGKSITLDYKDAELTFNDEIITRVATFMRELKPTVVITHWENSIHPDHALCPRIVQAAQLKAGLPGFDLDGLAPHFYPFYHSENWEDMEGYEPDVFIDVSEEFDTYLEAISKYWFVMNSSSFRYYDYYQALGTVRGCVSRATYAQTLKFPTGGNVRRGNEIPGHEL
ncbi:PIG-L deacetylase family protein [Oceanobacillus luteolus]|uniref:PIG-L deacetylase family protein n=1 Tax=Oceanobacillus luteolus TaxID=1274358 RepID=A0ABW4HRP6_9BACI